MGTAPSHRNAFTRLPSILGWRPDSTTHRHASMRQNRDEIQELREGHDEEEEGKKTPMEKEGGWRGKQKASQWRWEES
jgi:hypothetical protein